MSEPPWTVRRVLGWTTQHFEKRSVDAPRLTAELLLAHVLGVDRVRLYIDLDRPLEKERARPPSAPSSSGALAGSRRST